MYNKLKISLSNVRYSSQSADVYTHGVQLCPVVRRTVNTTVGPGQLFPTCRMSHCERIRVTRERLFRCGLACCRPDGHLSDDGFSNGRGVLARAPAPLVVQNRSGLATRRDLPTIVYCRITMKTLSCVQDALRKRKEEEDRVAQQNEFLNRSLRGSKKLRELEHEPPETGIVNDAFLSEHDDNAPTTTITTATTTTTTTTTVVTEELQDPYEPIYRVIGE